MAEYKTDKQVNYGFGLSFEATGKAPVVAKRIWNTLADAQAYVDSTTDTAIAGLQLTVINDTDASKNGVYFVKEAAGDNGKTTGVLVKLAAGGDTSALQEQVTANKNAIDKLNGASTVAGSVAKTVKDAVDALDVSSNTSDAVNGVTVTVNQADGKIQKPEVSITVGAVEANNTKFVTGGAVKTAIDNAVGTAYKVKGCKNTFKELTDSVTDGSYVPVVGDVWNIQTAFTLPDDNKPYPAGTNVVWVDQHEDVEDTHAAHWDALGGTVDLSGYVNNVIQGTSGNVVTSIVKDDSDVAVNSTYVGEIPLKTYSTQTSADVTAEDSVAVAIGKVEARAKAAETAVGAIDTGVTTFGGEKGAITVDDTGSGDYKVALKMTGKKLGAAISGLGTAAKHAEGDFATAEQGKLANNAAQLSGNMPNVNLHVNPGNLYVDSTFKMGLASDNGAFLTGFEGGNIFFENQTENANGGRIYIAETDGTQILYVKDQTDRNVVVRGVDTPVDTDDAANKAYVDDSIEAAVGIIDTGVTTFGGQKGAITVDSGKTALGDVNFTIGTDKKLTGKVAGLGSAAAKNVENLAQMSSGNSEVVNTGYIDTTLGFTAGQTSGIFGRLTQNTINLAMLKTDGANTFDSGFTIAPESMTKNVLAFSYMPNTSLGVELSGIATPTGDTCAANKQYVDAQVSSVMTWAAFE